MAGAPPGYVYRADTPRLRQSRVPYAYVKIAEGCNMGCTFCAIPLMRGRHRSRPLADVVAEVEQLARDGLQEAVLVSQDTLAWGKDLPGPGARGLRRPPPGALRHGDPVAPLPLSPSGARDGRARREARPVARPAVRRHADPARRRWGAPRHAARRDAAAHGARSSPASGRRSRGRPSARPCSSVSRARPRPPSRRSSSSWTRCASTAWGASSSRPRRGRRRPRCPTLSRPTSPRSGRG